MEKWRCTNGMTGDAVPAIRGPCDSPPDSGTAPGLRFRRSATRAPAVADSHTADKPSGQLVNGTSSHYPHLGSGDGQEPGTPSLPASAGAGRPAYGRPAPGPWLAIPPRPPGVPVQNPRLTRVRSAGIGTPGRPAPAPATCPTVVPGSVRAPGGATGPSVLPPSRGLPRSPRTARPFPIPTVIPVDSPSPPSALPRRGGTAFSALSTPDRLSAPRAKQGTVGSAAARQSYGRTGPSGPAK